MRGQLSFYVSAIGAALAGNELATVLGWGEDAVFIASMLPFSLVMLIFILRDEKPEPEQHIAARDRARLTAR